MSSQPHDLKIDEICMPLTMTSRIFALPAASTLHITNKRHRIMINIVECTYTCVLLVLYAMFLEKQTNDHNQAGLNQNSFIAQLAHWTERYFTAINVYILTICNLMHRKRIGNLAIDLYHVDRVLLKLGTYIHYRESRVRCFWATACTVIGIVLAGLCNSLLLAEVSILNFWIYSSVPMLIYCCVILQFSTYLYLVRQRYRILNDLLESHCLQTKQPPKINNFLATKNKVFVDEINPKMKQFDVSVVLDMIFELHDGLFEICRNINFSYGFQILVSLMISFITILSNIYAFISSKGLDQRVTEVTWALCHAMAILYIVISTSRTSDEATQTKLILHRARNANPDLKESTEMYSLQLLHQQVNFSACGFFALDYTLLYSIVGALTTYLVILIQFDMGEDTSSSGQNATLNDTMDANFTSL